MSQRKLRWSRLSQERLNDIGRYISLDSPQNAHKVVKDIRQAARDILPHPESKPLVRQLPSEDRIYRFVICHSYKIIYKIKPEYILILDIFHMSREPSNIERLRDIDS